jgi:hypothetical protein
VRIILPAHMQSMAPGQYQPNSSTFTDGHQCHVCFDETDFIRWEPAKGRTQDMTGAISYEKDFHLQPDIEYDMKHAGCSEGRCRTALSLRSESLGS